TSRRYDAFPRRRNGTGDSMNSSYRVTLLAAAVALAGCGEEKPAAKAESGAPTATAQVLEVRIGHVAPLTGSIAHLGKDNENGARLAIDEANEAKIEIGGQPTRFVLLPEDDQADPKVG